MANFNRYLKTHNDFSKLKESLENNVFGIKSFNSASYKYAIQDNFSHMMMFIIRRVNDECNFLWDVIYIKLIAVCSLLMGLAENRLTFFLKIKCSPFCPKLIF